ncbi:MAG: LacI family transcriptional regulator [Spirochaetes bacterium]|nr:LacI family transcriptional regulator [Spirochaetota bacterium]
MKKKLNIHDIAKLAGVSTKTVSRVINNAENVKDDTREKVLKVINEHNYHVNIMAKWMRHKKTHIIIIFVGIDSLEHWSEWRSLLIQKMIKESQSRNYRIIVSASAAEKDSVISYNDGFNLLKSGMADGAIMFDSQPEDIRINYLRDKKIPFVVFGKDVRYTDTTFVDLDNYQAGLLGGQHLMDKKNKKICILSGNDRYTVYQERIHGCIDAFRKHEDVHYIIRPNIFTTEQAYQAAAEVIKNDRPDAFFVLCGDTKAAGVYHAVYENHCKVPDDISILGFNNMALGQFLYPPLSTIDQSINEFSLQALTLLLDIIEGKVNETKRVYIKPKLIERQST